MNPSLRYVVPLIVCLSVVALPSQSKLPPVATADLTDLSFMRKGHSVLSVRFERPVRERWLRVFPNDRPTVIRDDGRWPDRVAGDGEFRGVAGIDFAAEARHFDAHREQIQKRKRIPWIVDRELRGWIEPQTVPKRTRMKMPIVSLGASRVVIDPDRSLFVRDLSVVEDPTRTYNPCTGDGDPNGVWTFKHLMTEMCNQSDTGIDPADFVENWLNTWMVDQTVNTFNVPARPGVGPSILANWPTIGGQLDLDKAPFRLLAIVNRVDLRKGSFYGGGTAGELRFVFCLVDCNTSTAKPFLVIFEYGVPISGCENVKAWGQQWVDLSTLTLGSAAYNNALEAMTQQVVVADAAPGRPNGSSLNQLRTNENELVGGMADPWELREFHLPSGGGDLVPATVAMTPDGSYGSGVPESDLTSWLDSVAPGPNIPLNLPGGGPLLGGNAIAFGPASTWNPPTSTWQRRHEFSLNTCNACHNLETETFDGPTAGFRHVKEEWYGTVAPLSKFLTGDPSNAADSFWHDVTDQVNSSVEHLFFDLEVRREGLDALVSSSCLGQVLFAELAMPH